MNDYVLDASALVLALSARTDAAGALRVRLPGMRRHAPHLVDAEVGSVLRRQERSGAIGSQEAGAALQATRFLIEYRYPHAGPLAELAWELRGNLSFYDALYVALAVRLGAPLLTGDHRLSRAPGLPCSVELV